MDVRSVRVAERPAAARRRLKLRAGPRRRKRVRGGSENASRNRRASLLGGAAHQQQLERVALKVRDTADFDFATDVVVTDWRAPGADGAEATRDLLARHPHIHAVGFTSSGTEK